MCGIAGIISHLPTEVRLRKMLAVMRHRGPDHTGIFIDPEFAAIGHNRLSIIDLSKEANEPFSSPEGRYLLTFNGEIYNYIELREQLRHEFTFCTTSDTEVLMAAFIRWGKDCLKHLNGMFAFGIWDNHEKKFFAARDRFGVKPFYYSISGKELIFSSEIKGIKAIKEDSGPNPGVWSNYFCHGSYGNPEETFYTGISQLPGGHLLEYSDGRLTTDKWYDFAENVSKETHNSRSFQEAQEQYLDILKDSIRLRFRADVPLGLNISGGVDSSLLLALVNQWEDKRKLSAYTFYTGDERYDELPWVHELMVHSDHPLHKVRLSSEEVPKLARRVSGIQDEPFGGLPTLAYAKLFERAHQDGIRVLLDGQGMDEQWAGYNYYWKSDQTIQGIDQNPYRKNVLEPDFAALAEKPDYPEPFPDDLQNKQYRDLFFTKIPRVLRFNDRISMAASTELREPFLDYRLVEFAFAQPVDYKKRGDITKYMLRDILGRLATRGISYAPKRPLQTPQREWLKEELKGFVQEQLDYLKKSPHSDWFRPREIDLEWQKYLHGENHSSFHLWQWINYSLLFGNNNSDGSNSQL